MLLAKMQNVHRPNCFKKVVQRHYTASLKKGGAKTLHRYLAEKWCKDTTLLPCRKAVQRHYNASSQKGGEKTRRHCTISSRKGGAKTLHY
jgi:hypothetical protein